MKKLDKLLEYDTKISSLIQKATEVGRAGEDGITDIELELAHILQWRDELLKDIFECYDIGLKVSYGTRNTDGKQCHTYDLIYT